MKLQVVHRTTYEYAQAVTQNYNELRLQPVTQDGQTCETFNLNVSPNARLGHYLDFYLNYVHFFEVSDPHQSLVIESTSQVSTTDARLPDGAATRKMDRLPECLRLEKCYDFLQPSTFVATSPEVWRLAVDATHGQSDVWQAAVAIRRFIHESFSYTPNATDVNTHMLEFLKLRRGVCQDFTHLMLGMCRVLKIPARYVSGYLYNGPTETLRGCQASHAWCEVFVPDLGWHGLDPTNNSATGEHYVKVGVGRDYADIVPIKGRYKGTPDRKMSVHVEIKSL